MVVRERAQAGKRIFDRHAGARGVAGAQAPADGRVQPDQEVDEHLVGGVVREGTIFLSDGEAARGVPAWR